MIVCDKCGAGVRSENRFELHLASKECSTKSVPLMMADYCDKCANVIRSALVDVIRSARFPLKSDKAAEVTPEMRAAMDKLRPAPITGADLLAQLVEENKV